MDLPKTKEDIEKLIEARVQESLNLDYKRSNAIDDKKRAEIAKDVSAFANSDGGLLIYGIEEEEHLPIKMDSGVEHKKFNREWLENVITSNTTPRIEDILIAQIPLSGSHSIFAVKIPKSFRGPHQERLESKRYYRRFNFKSVPMEDYEVREAYNRRSEVLPLVYVDMEIRRGLVEIVLTNQGNSTAQDVRLQFSEGMAWLNSREPKDFANEGIAGFPPGRVLRLAYNLSYSIFKELDDRAKRFYVNVDYFHPELKHRMSERYAFDLNDFKYSLTSETDVERLTKELVKEIKHLTDEAKKIDGRLAKITQIASSTGLDISIPTIENLRHVVERTGEVEKIYPLNCSSQVFTDVLKVPSETGERFAAYFSGSGSAESVSEIEGVKPEILERFNHYFVQLKVLKPPPNKPFAFQIEPPESSES